MDARSVLRAGSTRRACAEARELVAEAGGDDLRQLLGIAQALETVPTEGAKLERGVPRLAEGDDGRR